MFAATVSRAPTLMRQRGYETSRRQAGRGAEYRRPGTSSVRLRTQARSCVSSEMLDGGSGKQLRNGVARRQCGGIAAVDANTPLTTEGQPIGEPIDTIYRASLKVDGTHTRGSTLAQEQSELASSPGRRCLSGDRRDLGERVRRLHCPLRVFQMVAADSCERFPQVCVEARGILKRRVENGFHLTSHNFVGANRKFADRFFEKHFATTSRKTRVATLAA
jgi:hypothetical protein